MNTEKMMRLEALEDSFGDRDFKEYILNVKEQKRKELNRRANSFEQMVGLYYGWLKEEYNGYQMNKEDMYETE